MKKGVLKRIIALSTVLLVTFGVIGIQPAGAKKEKAEGIEKLYEWYADFQTSDDESDSAKDVDGIVRAQATRYLGSAFWVAVGRSGSSLVTESVSVGYRAYKVYNGNRANGFVTCGHACIDSIDHNVYNSSWGSGRFGRIEESVLDSNCDASFVSVLSGTTISSQTHGKGGSKATISTTIKTVNKGDRVVKCGATTGVLSANVLNPSTSAWISVPRHGVLNYRNIISTGYMSRPGDSGSPVYKTVAGTHYLVGIVVAGDGETVTYVRAAGTINSRLGTKPY